LIVLTGIILVSSEKETRRRPHRKNFHGAYPLAKRWCVKLPRVANVRQSLTI